MSMKLAVPSKKTDLFKFLPGDIIVRSEENCRVTPRSQEEIEATARSILTHGQQEPCVVRRLTDTKAVQLVAGYGRYLAVKHINEVLQPDNPIHLECRVVETSPENAFVLGLVENIDRSELTPLDKAYATERLVTVYKWEKSRVAELFKQSVAYISKLHKSTTLSTAIKEEVATGNLSLNGASELLEVPEEQREQIVEEAKDPATGKVQTEKVRRRVREIRSEEGKGTPRSLKEIKKFLTERTQMDQRPSVRGLCKRLLEYVEGSVTDTQMDNALNKFCSQVDEE